jgi:hypothetical protein
LHRKALLMTGYRLQSVRLDGKATVAESITALAAEVRENVRLRRAFWCAQAGCLLKMACQVRLA